MHQDSPKSALVSSIDRVITLIAVFPEYKELFSNMKIYLLLIVCVSLALAQEPPPPSPEPTGPPSPSKHPFRQCLDTYNTCVQNAGAEWEPQKTCFLAFYECQNKYTAECRKLFRNKACYNLIGKEECWKRLRACYGSS